MSNINKNYYVLINKYMKIAFKLIECYPIFNKFIFIPHHLQYVQYYCKKILFLLLVVWVILNLGPPPEV